MHEKRPTCVWKETYIYIKWDFMCGKNLQIWKENHLYISRNKKNVHGDLHKHEKRPICMQRHLHIWKEIYIDMKRDLHDKKRPS